MVTVSLGKHLNAIFFVPGSRLAVIYSLMQQDGIGSTFIICVQGSKLGRDTNCTEE